MDIKGLVWVGTRTPRADDMARFVESVLGIPRDHEEHSEGTDLVAFRFANGSVLETFGPDDRGHDFFDTGPVPGFLVDDVHAAKAEMEEAGIEFLDPEVGSARGYQWAHFRGPDGNVYEITNGPYGA